MPGRIDRGNANESSLAVSTTMAAISKTYPIAAAAFVRLPIPSRSGEYQSPVGRKRGVAPTPDYRYPSGCDDEPVAEDRVSVACQAMTAATATTATAKATGRNVWPCGMPIVEKS